MISVLSRPIQPRTKQTLSVRDARTAKHTGHRQIRLYNQEPRERCPTHGLRGCEIDTLCPILRACPSPSRFPCPSTHATAESSRANSSVVDWFDDWTAENAWWFDWSKSRPTSATAAIPRRMPTVASRLATRPCSGRQDDSTPIAATEYTRASISCAAAPERPLPCYFGPPNHSRVWLACGRFAGCPPMRRTN